MSEPENINLRRRVIRGIILSCLFVCGFSVPIVWWTIGFSHLLILTALNSIVCVYLLIWAGKHIDDLRHTIDGRSMTSLGLANNLTIIRMMMIPTATILIMYLPADQPWIKRGVALVLVIFVSLADSLDGFLARRLHQITRFGTFLDPTADFFLLLLLTTALVVRGLAPAWLLVLAALKIILLMVGGTILLRKKAVDRTALNPLRLGKIATASVLGCMIISLISWVFGLHEEKFLEVITILYYGAGGLLALALVEKLVWFFALVRKIKGYERQS